MSRVNRGCYCKDGWGPREGKEPEVKRARKDTHDTKTNQKKRVILGDSIGKDVRSTIGGRKTMDDTKRKKEGMIRGGGWSDTRALNQRRFFSFSFLFWTNNGIDRKTG